VGLTASGTYAWQQAPTAGTPALLAGPDGAVVWTDPGGATENLQGLAADGSSQWTTSTPTSGFVAVPTIFESQGVPIIVAFINASAIFGAAPPLTSVGGYDVAYQIFDSTGHLASVGSWGTPDDEDTASIAIDASGNVVITASTDDPTSESTKTLWFVKLAR
jgi:hypothetical protein